MIAHSCPILAMQVHFQEETLTDILSRLSVRSLLRFKCVSKYLKTLIDDPIFKKQHLNRAKNDQNSQNFLFYKGPSLDDDTYSICCCPISSDQQVGDVRKLDFPSNLKPEYSNIYYCCDGLVIIKVYGHIPRRYSLLLWNPFTGESIELPTSEFSVEEFCCYGMSFDSTNDDYKILRIPSAWSKYCRVPSEILSLKSGYWRKIDACPRNNIHSMFYGIHSLAIIHGAFHWVAMSYNACFVVSFNISHEMFGEIIPLPEKMWLYNINIGVLELGDMLCAYTTEYYQRKRTFKLWILKDYGLKDSWNEVISIVDPNIIIASPKYRFADGEVLIWCKHFEGEENSFRTQRGPFTLLPRGYIRNGFTFTESLISPRLLIT
uniref:Ubiquitin-protein ligase n=1 Tax=Solanum tuberosum TaxID=4113 RepID=M1DTK2_SOLTU